jgi:hypothetical protein
MTHRQKTAFGFACLLAFSHLSATSAFADACDLHLVVKPVKAGARAAVGFSAEEVLQIQSALNAKGYRLHDEYTSDEVTAVAVLYGNRFQKTSRVAMDYYDGSLHRIKHRRDAEISLEFISSYSGAQQSFKSPLSKKQDKNAKNYFKAALELVNRVPECASLPAAPAVCGRDKRVVKVAQPVQVKVGVMGMRTYTLPRGSFLTIWGNTVYSGDNRITSGEASYQTDLSAIPEPMSFGEIHLQQGDTSLGCVIGNQ